MYCYNVKTNYNYELSKFNKKDNALKINTNVIHERP